MDAEELITRYGVANAADDFDTLESLRHPEWQQTWPQTGETVPSSANYRAVRLGRPEGAPKVTGLRHGGSGDAWWSEMAIDYADGSRWLGITIYELRDGLIWRERLYFGQPFEAPAWRAPWVESGPNALG